ncbi:MAG TPA: MFS transporter [Planctomycetes bacterium]|nr:MFS transporter [Planctomycetota bacterium]
MSVPSLSSAGSESFLAPAVPIGLRTPPLDCSPPRARLPYTAGSACRVPVSSPDRVHRRRRRGVSGLRSNRSFWWLSGSQFLGAFNDNIFKQFILILAIKIQIDWLPIDAQATAFAIFSLPFILFAILGGSLADRFSKRQVIVAMNTAEIGVMILGAVAFALDAISVDWAISGAMLVLFLMGTQSALFGPSKYGILPEMVEEKQMTRANGIINMLTNVAIIFGTLFATYLYDFLHPVVGPGHPNWWSGLVFITIASAGWLLSLNIRKGIAADPERKLIGNPLVGFSEIRHVARDRPLLAAVLANSWFYFVGAMAMMAFNSYGENLLGMTGGGELFFWVAIGIAAGSLLASRLSGEYIELGLVPVGALGMGIGFAALYWLPAEPIWLIDVFLLVAGVSGGIYLVPLAAYIQQRPPAREKGRVLGAQELLNFTLIFLSAAVYALLVSDSIFAFDERQVMLALGCLAFFGALGTFLTAPHVAIRFPLWLLTHTIYRIKVLHIDRIPRRGGALIVVNHISYADPFLVGASLPRYVRFLMHRSFTKVPLVGPFSRIMKAIPVSDADGPRALVRSLEAAAEYARNGELVCIFAEGGISRTGNLLPFSKGLELVARAGNVPIIPMYLDRVWGSIFSFKGKKFFFKRPLKFPYPITGVTERRHRLPGPPGCSGTERRSTR